MSAEHAQDAQDSADVGNESRRSFLRIGGAAAVGGAAAAAAAVSMPMGVAGAGLDPGVVPGYTPVNPVRVYDSRSGPKIQPNESRNLLTNFLSGTPYAVTVNLTATQTENAGFLAMFPGDIGWPGTSSVNWIITNQDVANNAFVAIPGNNLITVLCGGTGATHFVIDVIGAVFLYDTTALASAESFQAKTAEYRTTVQPWTRT